MIELYLLGIFFVILFIITIVMFKNKIIFRLGIRNIFRRKGFAAIVILGLMVGTGIISSSLVIGDTMDNMIETEILKSFYTTDEIVVGRKPTGESDFFSISIFNEIKNQIDNEFIDGLTPHISGRISILNKNTNLSEPSIELLGIDFDNAQNFGNFIDQNGNKITDLDNDQLMLGGKTAEDLNAKIGHTIILYSNNSLHTFKLTHILKAKERASIGEGIYITLQKAQQILDKKDMINQILISNKGDVYEGMEYTDEVTEDFENVEISHEIDFEIMLTKKDVLEKGKESMEQFSNMFFIFGTFSIIAGIILIVNIFVMLSEERKSEMGMVRAIGMQRKHLKRMYLAEGTIYALIASFLGVFFGIGIGYVIIFVLKEILSSFGEFDILSYFTFTSSSLIIGFVSGFIITILTIYVTSHRISKLNIVRAIRNIPEPTIPRSDKKMMIIGFLILIFGFLLIAAGIFNEQIASFVSGLSLIVFGIGIIIRRWIGNKIALNLVGIIILIIWVLPSDYFPEYTGGIEMFIVSGLFLVFAALIIVMSNSDAIIKGLTFIIGRGKSAQAVIKTAISYALKSKFRTGMTIAIFALIIFTITTMSMITGILGTNIGNQVQKASGGYEIFASSNPLSPIEDIEQKLIDEELFDKIEKISAPVSGRVLLNKTSIYGENVYYTLIGVDDNFIDENEFEFVELKDTYKTEKDAWNAVKNNKNLIIIDGTVVATEQYGPSYSLFYAKLGEKIQLIDKEDNIVEKEIIGIIDSIFIQGIFSYEQFVEDEFGIAKSTVFLFSAKQNEDVDELAKEIESKFLINGMQAVVVRTMVLESIEIMNQFFYLFDAFMALGLIIGIAGLGIITIRSVHERRQEIGMMRAIGFKRRMVLSAFLVETSIISLLGILIGTTLGIFTGYIIWRDGFKQLDFEFLINWQPILTVAIIAFIFTMICIIPASRKASKIPPAEALRYEG